MKTRKIIVALLMLLLMFAIAACGTQQNSTSDNSKNEADTGSISSRREGIHRESLPFSGRFAASENGVYSLNPIDPPNANSQTVLFYTDYGSDTAVRVCSRPDCTHNDESCDAVLQEADIITFYNEHLYYSEVTVRSDSDYRFSLKVIRVDPDGRNRICVMDTQKYAQFDNGDFGYPDFSDGMFFFKFFWLDEDGAEQVQTYYYRLDGSLSELQPVDVPLLFGTDGDKTFFYDPEEKVEYSVWNPEEMSLTPLFTLDPEASCYMAEENAYILTDNTIYRKDYETGEETLLFDTGLTGTHRMRCFPDCIVVMDGIAYDGSEPEIEQQTLRFYSWDFEPLGEIVLDFTIMGGYASPIAAETPDKLLVRVDHTYLPWYYIDKAEFGTGNITLHEFKLPADLPPAIGESTSE